MAAAAPALYPSGFPCSGPVSMNSADPRGPAGTLNQVSGPRAAPDKRVDAATGAGRAGRRSLAGGGSRLRQMAAAPSAVRHPSVGRWSQLSP